VHGSARVEDLVDRFQAGDGFAENATDFGVPAEEVEDVIRVALRSPPEFFIDRRLGRGVVPDALRAADSPVHVMADVYGERIGSEGLARDHRPCRIRQGGVAARPARTRKRVNSAEREWARKITPWGVPAADASRRQPSACSYRGQ
jgi:hypothetical protein